MNFHVGQKVVCVDTNLVVSGASLGPLRKGDVYTVRKIGNYKHPSNGLSGLCIWLEEIVRYEAKDMPYFIWRFKPVAEKKTDISIFTAMLNPKKEQVK